MVRIKRAPHIVLLIVALVAFAAAPAAAQGSDQRPYKSTDVGTAVIGDCIPAPDVNAFAVRCPVETVGSGIATHLGLLSSTSEGTGLIDPLNGCEVLDGSPGITVTTAGSFVFTAANGDELHGDFANTLCFGATDSAINGTQTFIGGTGRFADATGTTLTFGTSFTDGTFNLTAVGTVGY